jgi:hypothetical protein
MDGTGELAEVLGIGESSVEAFRRIYFGKREDDEAF